MSTIPITVELPVDTVNSIRTLASRRALSVDDMIELASNASTASKAVIDAVKLDDKVLNPKQGADSARSQNTGSLRTGRDFLITICNVKSQKYFPLKVNEQMLNYDLAKIVGTHEGVPQNQILLMGKKGRLIYGFVKMAVGSPVKMKKLSQDGVEDGDLVTLSLNENVDE